MYACTAKQLGPSNTNHAEYEELLCRMYRQDLERDDNGVVGSTSNVAASGNLRSEVAEIRVLLRVTGQVVFPLSQSVNAMQEEIKHQRTENAKIFKALKTSIEFLEGLLQAKRK
ncbi:uncharacterized protein LOC144133904 [Amblyomma americanum]